MRIEERRGEGRRRKKKGGEPKHPRPAHREGREHSSPYR